jgi:chromosome segregation ATPase
MYLKELTLVGFKSFSHRTTLTFTPGITSIVGPNGSGKSNLAEAVRWAMGEQSMKALRGKRSEDVIFAGSASKARQGLAMVRLTFDNADGQIPDVGAEAVIERRIDRSGESTYLINGREVRLADVTQLLAAAGVGAKTYTVIGQGAIDAIVNATPQERREIFEDASGVRPLQIKKQLCLRRLAHTAQNMQRVEDLLAELTPRMKSLSRKAARARSRAKIQQKLSSLAKRWYRARWFRIVARLRKFQAEQAALAEKVRIWRKKTAKTERQLRKLEKQEGLSLSELQSHLDRRLEEENKLRQQLAQIASPSVNQAADIAVTRAQLLAARQEYHQKISTLRQRLLALRNRRRQLEESLWRSTTVTDTTQQLVPFLQKPLRKLEKVLRLLRSKRDKFPLIQIRNQLAQVRETLLQAIAKMRGREGEEENPREALAQIDEKLQHAAAALQKWEIKAGVLTERLKLLEQTASGDSRPAAVRRLETLAQEIARLRQVIRKKTLAEEQRHKDLVAAERRFSQNREVLRKWEEKLRELELNLMRATEQRNLLREHIIADLGNNFLAELSSAPLPESLPSVRKEDGQLLKKLKQRLARLAPVDPGVIAEYREIAERVDFLARQLNDLKETSRNLKKGIHELERHIRDAFHASVARINEHFRRYFRTLFGGGQASLVIQKQARLTAEKAGSEIKKQQAEDEMFSREQKESELPGIELRVHPPGKRISHIHQLSGGEKSLASIAMLFAVLAANPSPFVILDEVDAALDEANSRRFAEILQQLARRSQFIMITHNRETMRVSKVLYGVTMRADGVSRVLSLQLKEEMRKNRVRTLRSAKG